MQNEKLTALIALLKAELATMEENEGTRQLIEKVQKDLDALEKSKIESSPSDPESKNTFLESAVNFEESHPKLASTLNDIAHMLASMGI